MSFSGPGVFIKRLGAPRWLAPMLALALLSCAPRPIEPEALFAVGPDGTTSLIVTAGQYDAEIASGRYVVLETGMSVSWVTAILDSRGGGYDGPRPRKFAEPYDGEVFTVIHKLNKGNACPWAAMEVFFLFDRHDRLVGGKQRSSGNCPDTF